MLAFIEMLINKCARNNLAKISESRSSQDVQYFFCKMFLITKKIQQKLKTIPSTNSYKKIGNFDLFNFLSIITNIILK